jgi:hypothetical protein
MLDSAIAARTWNSIGPAGVPVSTGWSRSKPRPPRWLKTGITPPADPRRSAGENPRGRSRPLAAFTTCQVMALTCMGAVVSDDLGTYPA